VTVILSSGMATELPWEACNRASLFFFSLLYWFVFLFMNNRRLNLTVETSGKETMHALTLNLHKTITSKDARWPRWPELKMWKAKKSTTSKWEIWIWQGESMLLRNKSIQGQSKLVTLANGAFVSLKTESKTLYAKAENQAKCLNRKLNIQIK
jgi:hypothetical protein